MIKLVNANSMGCVEYGNNNFFEVMRDTTTGEVGLMSHEEPLEENSDGTYTGDADSVDEYIDSIKDRDDFAELMKELLVVLINNQKT